jgi:hypothetical protein
MPSSLYESGRFFSNSSKIPASSHAADMFTSMPVLLRRNQAMGISHVERLVRASWRRKGEG